MRKPITLLALSITLTGALNACGQKGPLYLPQDAAAPSTASRAGQPQSEPAVTQNRDAETSAEKRSQHNAKDNTEQHTEAEAVAK